MTMQDAQTRRRHRNSTGGSIAAFLLLVASAGLPVQLHAQCPGVTTTLIGNNVLMRSYPGVHPDPDELYDFIGTGGCTSMVFGTMPPASCLTNRASTIAYLGAAFFSPTSNTTGNGCTFNCDGGTCRVRGGDALPVELMDFGIEDADFEPPDDRQGEGHDAETEDANDR